MIVHIITGLGRGGAEHALYRLLSQEIDIAHVRVVSLTDEGIFGPRLRALGANVTCLRLNPRLPSPAKFIQLIRQLRRWQPKLVQTWMYHGDLVGGLAGRLAGIPVCWGVRQTDLSQEHSRLSTRLVARACALLSASVPARIISCSMRAVSVHQALGYSAPFAVVPNGLDTSAWLPQPDVRASVRADLGLPADVFLYVHVGRADPQKGHPALARAFNEVLTKRPHAWLLLCGSGLLPGEPSFDALPFTAEARRHVVALGPRDDISSLLQAGDSFVLSSSFGEGFPNVVAEAMACGLPCVVTDVGDAAEIVGETGLVVPPFDHHRLAQAMLGMLNMSSVDREKLGRSARERIEAGFTLEKMAAGFHRVWDEIFSEIVS